MVDTIIASTILARQIMHTRDDMAYAVLRSVGHLEAARTPMQVDIGWYRDAGFVNDGVPLIGGLAPRVEAEQARRLLGPPPHDMGAAALAQLRKQHCGGQAVDEAGCALRGRARAGEDAGRPVR